MFFNIRLEPEMHRQLDRLARENDRTIAGEIRAAIRRHLEAVAPKSPEARTTCPTCRGTGGGQWNDCPTCDGNGIVE